MVYVYTFIGGKWHVRGQLPDKVAVETPLYLSGFFVDEKREVCETMTQKNSFTQGPILGPMLRFTLPVLGAILLQTMYGAVDMLVVGRFAEAADVSAVSTGSWLMQLVTSLITGVSMGTTVLLGRRIGEERPEEAGRLIGASIVLFALITAVITVLMECFANPIARIMQVPKEAFSATLQYVRICAGGAVFIVAYNVLGSIFRGLGNSRIPLMTVAIACVVNIAGDLLLVGALRMAAAGAAIATVAAQGISVALSLLIIRKQKMPFAFRLRDIRWDAPRMGEVLRMGLPIALQDVLVSVSFLAITAIVNSLGVIVSAGVGVAEKLCGFVMLVPSAFGQSMAAIVAQNIGAKQYARAKKCMLYGIGASLAAGAVMAYFAFFHGEPLSMIFARDAQVVAASAEYLKATAIDTLLVSIMFVMVGYFNGCGKTFFVMLQGILGAFGVRIPVSLAMSRLTPVSVFAVGLATPASTVLQIVLCVGYYVMLRRRERKTQLIKE